MVFEKDLVQSQDAGVVGKSTAGVFLFVLFTHLCSVFFCSLGGVGTPMRQCSHASFVAIAVAFSSYPVHGSWW